MGKHFRLNAGNFCFTSAAKQVNSILLQSCANSDNRYQQNNFENS